MKKMKFLALVGLMGLAGCATGTGDTGSVRSAITGCFELETSEIELCLGDVEEEGGAGVEEVIDVCFEEHGECLVYFEDPEACDPLLEACLEIWDEPLPPGPIVELCYFEAVECPEVPGIDPVECIEMLDICIELVHPEPVAPPCEEAHFCFEGLESPDDAGVCEELLDHCLEWGPVEPGPCEPGEPAPPEPGPGEEPGGPGEPAPPEPGPGEEPGGPGEPAPPEPGPGEEPGEPAPPEPGPGEEPGEPPLF